MFVTVNAIYRVNIHFQIINFLKCNNKMNLVDLNDKSVFQAEVVLPKREIKLNEVKWRQAHQPDKLATVARHLRYCRKKAVDSTGAVHP